MHLNKKPTRFWEKYLQPSDDISYERKLFLAEERIRNKGKKRNDKINKQHKEIKYNIGDLVLVKALNVSNKLKKLFSKFMSVFEGPYQIKEKFNATYSLIHSKTLIDRGKFHTSLLKKYHASTVESSSTQN